MDLHLLIVSFIEGITEFLPISSTAHLILVSKFLNVDTSSDYIKFYLLFIQMGALLAGVILFSKKILNDRKLLINVFISFIPSAVVGFIFYKMFKKLLEGDMVILSIALFVGGCIFIYLERFFIKRVNGVKNGEHDFGKAELSKIDAFIVGLAQSIAIIPGVSRSGATIVAGILRGVKKSVIIEYTFLLALPTLGAAVFYDMYKSREMLLELNNPKELIVGFAVSFFTSFIILFFLKKYIKKISLTLFGIYRIVLAILIFVNFIYAVQASVPVPTIVISPDKVSPGEPLLVTINASSTISSISFDSKNIASFLYKNKYRALIPVPFEEKDLEKVVKVELVNGMTFSETITLIPREKIEKPLGIPENLGGNTEKAASNLMNNLAIENARINNIKTATTSLWAENFIDPVQSVFITDDYGYNRNTVGQVITHKGTDFRASVGTEVFAMNDGIVREASVYTVYGNTVIIDHGLGLQTLYMHLSELKVKIGDKVKKGDLIGLSGKTGYAEGAHLHISVKINGISIDPIKFLDLFVI